MRRYSLVHLTNGTCPPPLLIQQAAEAGYQCVSLRGIPARGSGFPSGMSGAAAFDLAGSRQLLLDTRRALEQTGIALNDMENARIYPGSDVQAYQRDLETAAELGCRRILSNVWSQDRTEALEKFQQLCEMAAKCGQSVHLEFVTWSAVRDLSEAAAFLRRAGQENVGIVVDTLHFYRSEVSMEELEGLPPQWFSYVHLCDCGAEIPRDAETLARTGVSGRMIPGEGAVDIKGILRRLPPVVLGLEVPNEKRMAELGAQAYLKELLEKTKAFLDGAAEH